ncbi:hypothetical protein L6164_013097 [Bauhinia variegata]|uniref:Uncharacterized protein n=1 Tax=Bauhinia variegata TaxID=167791 RepID=A0ACB9PDI0_BAUVA|nr:hypothetical protein L6164_013097 [Bauhinia variegata]
MLGLGVFGNGGKRRGRGGCHFRRGRPRRGIKKCAKSMIGRVIANRTINPKTLESVMKVVWGNAISFRIHSLEGNKFLFFIHTEVVLIRIEKGHF